MPSTNQEFWSMKFSATIRRDSRVLRELHAKGWRTMIIWECQLEKDTIPAINRAANWLVQANSALNPSLDVGHAINRTALIRAATEKVKARTRRYSTSEPLAGPGVAFKLNA
jgi:DNA mismatch endonuclease (patch repair protein)